MSYRSLQAGSSMLPMFSHLSIGGLPTGMSPLAEPRGWPAYCCVIQPRLPLSFDETREGAGSIPSNRDMSLNCLVHCLNQRATCAVQCATTLRTHSREPGLSLQLTAATAPGGGAVSRETRTESGGIVRSLTVLLDTVSGTHIRQPLAVHGPKVGWSNSTPI